MTDTLETPHAETRGRPKKYGVNGVDYKFGVTLPKEIVDWMDSERKKMAEVEVRGGTREMTRTEFVYRALKAYKVRRSHDEKRRGAKVSRRVTRDVV